MVVEVKQNVPQLFKAVSIVDSFGGVDGGELGVDRCLCRQNSRFTSLKAAVSADKEKR
jgi:hypothetical protein